MASPWTKGEESFRAYAGTSQGKMRCARCRKEATFVCAGCKYTAYCSKECQTADRAVHALVCNGSLKAKNSSRPHVGNPGPDEDNKLDEDSLGAFVAAVASIDVNTLTSSAELTTDEAAKLIAEGGETVFAKLDGIADASDAARDAAKKWDAAGASASFAAVTAAAKTIVQLVGDSVGRTGLINLIAAAAGFVSGIAATLREYASYAWSKLSSLFWSAVGATKHALEAGARFLRRTWKAVARPVASAFGLALAAIVRTLGRAIARQGAAMVGSVDADPLVRKVFGLPLALLLSIVKLPLVFRETEAAVDAKIQEAANAILDKASRMLKDLVTPEMESLFRATESGVSRAGKAALRLLDGLRATAWVKRILAASAGSVMWQVAKRAAYAGARLLALVVDAVISVAQNAIKWIWIASKRSISFATGGTDEGTVFLAIEAAKDNSRAAGRNDLANSFTALQNEYTASKQAILDAARERYEHPGMSGTERIASAYHAALTTVEVAIASYLYASGLKDTTRFATSQTNLSSHSAAASVDAPMAAAEAGELHLALDKLKSGAARVYGELKTPDSQHVGVQYMSNTDIWRVLEIEQPQVPAGAMAMAPAHIVPPVAVPAPSMMDFIERGAMLTFYTTMAIVVAMFYNAFEADTTKYYDVFTKAIEAKDPVAKTIKEIAASARTLETWKQVAAERSIPGALQCTNDLPWTELVRVLAKPEDDSARASLEAALGGGEFVAKLRGAYEDAGSLRDYVDAGMHRVWVGHSGVTHDRQSDAFPFVLLLSRALWTRETPTELPAYSWWKPAAWLPYTGDIKEVLKTQIYRTAVNANTDLLEMTARQWQQETSVVDQMETLVTRTAPKVWQSIGVPGATLLVLGTGAFASGKYVAAIALLGTQAIAMCFGIPGAIAALAVLKSFKALMFSHGLIVSVTVALMTAGGVVLGRSGLL